MHAEVPALFDMLLQLGVSARRRGNLKSSLAMTISKSGVEQNNFIDKFANYVIKFIFNDIFTTYMLPE